MDQDWNNANHNDVTLRYNDWSALSYDPFGPANILSGIYQHRSNKGITFDHSLMISPRFLANFRYTVTRREGSFYNSSANADPTQFGLNSAFIAQMPHATLPKIQGIAIGYKDGGLGTAQQGTVNFPTT